MNSTSKSLSSESSYRETTKILGRIIYTRYKVIQPLGSGAFGQTYLAQDLDRPGEPICVVKQLKLQTSDPGSQEVAKTLFNREAETLRQLGAHEHIPQILDFFEEAQEFYLVQEYIEGKTLREELDHHELWHEGKAILFLQEVLEILKFVHSKGMIHRDIKPENIIRRAQDRDLFLIDFGAVKQVWDSNQKQTSPTIIHTCGYSPPEQLAGMPEFNSDLYALGMTCIEALTGVKPEFLAQQRNARTREINWSSKIRVSNEFKSLLNKMVCIDAQNRYPSVSHAVRELHHLSSLAHPNQTPESVEPERKTINSNSHYTPTVITPPKADSGSHSEEIEEDDSEQDFDHRLGSKVSKLQQKNKPNSKQIFVELTEQLKPKYKIPKLEVTTKNANQFLKEKFVLLSGFLVFMVFGLSLLSLVIHPKPPIQLAQPSQLLEPLNSKKTDGVEQMAMFEKWEAFKEHTSSIKFLGFTSDDQLISSSEEGLVKLRDLKTQSVKTLTRTQNRILAVAGSANGEALAIATNGKFIEVWNLKQLKKNRQLSTEQLSWSLSLSPNGETLAESGLGSVKLWKNLQSKPKMSENHQLLFKDSEPIKSIALSSDTYILAGGSADGTIKIFNFAGSTSHTFNGHSKVVNSIAINVSDTVLFSGSEDDTIRLWNVYAPQEMSTIQADLGGVKAIAIHPNGKIVAGGGYYGTVKLWDWHTGKLISSFSNHLTEITALAFSSDGRTLAAGDGDGEIVIYTSK